MHELSVTQQVLDIAVEKAKENKATAIKQIDLVIGDLSSVIDDSVQFYFDILSRGTLAEGAKLQFHRIPLKVRCRRCNHEFAAAGEDWTCPQCREMDCQIVAGNEFYLESIEVEQ
jgi:hydrogenase nickel incorporation protein HypA/HybF